MNRNLKIGLAISSIAIALAVFAHHTILQAPPAVSEAPKTEIVDASKVKILSFDFDLTKNGVSINSSTASVMSGETYKYGVTDSTGYIESAIDKDGIVTLVPGAVTSGFELELTPVLLTGGNVTLSVNGTQTDLNSLETVETDGLKVQKPNTSSYATMQVVQVVQGQTFQTKLVDRENAKDKYVLTIKANI